MPPKVDLNDPAIKELLDTFATVSITGSKATETLKNRKQADAIAALIHRNALAQKDLDAKQGAFVVTIASSNITDDKKDYAVKKVLTGALDTDDRVKAAVKYLGTLGDQPVEEAAFDQECGVGVTVTREQVDGVVRQYLVSNKDKLAAKGRPLVGPVLGSLRSVKELRWANTADVKTSAEEEIERIWPKSQYQQDAAANATASSSSSSKPAKPAKESSADIDPDAMFKEGFLSRLHAPGGNPQVDPALKDQHLESTKSRVFTRFPPEPNGFLHIGHTKAIAIDFGYARYHDGLCYLRFDDTNPEAEEGVYFDSILETVRWLGYEPWKITYSSDYFQQLYELAVKLIQAGKAYVDHSTAEEIRQERGGEERGPRKASRYRDRPIEESLKEFEDMKNGKYKKGTVTLRMKQDLLNSGNPQMWDLIAYRVLDTPHHRTGSKWKIYPTYDFTHCLVDSFENISHSLCTTEFILSRESYEWLCDAVQVYKPRQYEFGRLNLEGTITSKRKIRALVEGKYVKDWDDPRLFTVIAIRRRGVPPGAILSFVNQLGVSTSVSQIYSSRLDQSIRQYLETSTPRLMMLLDPVPVVLENVPEDYLTFIEKPLHPKVPALGTNKVPFSRKLYIDASDFRVQDDPDYFRLAPGKSVGLFQAPFPITCTGYELDEKSGRVTSLKARYEDPSMGGNKLEKAQLKKISYIQWIGEDAQTGSSPVRIEETRIFHPLFKVDNPAGQDDFLKHVDPESLEVHKDAMIETGIWDVAKNSMLQARKEAEERTKKSRDERVKMSERGGKDVIRMPSGCTPLNTADTGKGAPEGTVEQLIGYECVRFQAMRVAYFALDKETVGAALEEWLKGGDCKGNGYVQGTKLILNRIVSLKEDTGKRAA